MNSVARALIDLDLPALRAFWATKPHLPQIKTDRDALVCAHMARTQAVSIPLKHRAYSHRWLLDRGLPSQLPDDVKPRAERLYPVVVDGVGIAVLGTSELGRQVAPIVRQAMSDAVEECYADGKREPEVVRPRMLEARDATVRKLLGKER